MSTLISFVHWLHNVYVCVCVRTDTHASGLERTKVMIQKKNK